MSSKPKLLFHKILSHPSIQLTGKESCCLIYIDSRPSLARSSLLTTPKNASITTRQIARTEGGLLAHTRQLYARISGNVNLATAVHAHTILQRTSTTQKNTSQNFARLSHRTRTLASSARCVPLLITRTSCQSITYIRWSAIPISTCSILRQSGVPSATKMTTTTRGTSVYMHITGRTFDAKLTFIITQKISAQHGATRKRHEPTRMVAALSTDVASATDGRSKNTIFRTTKLWSADPLAERVKRLTARTIITKRSEDIRI